MPVNKLATQLNLAGLEPELQALVLSLAHCCVEISELVRRGPLAGVHGLAGSENIQGEDQKKLDVVSNQILLDQLSSSGLCRGIGSEEMDDPILLGDGTPYLVLFDPLDGSSNIEVNISIGTIFSILPAPTDRALTPQDFLQPGTRQLMAGYVVYGPATSLVLLLKGEVRHFVLDPQTGNWLCTGERLQIGSTAKEFAINTSNARHWYAPMQRFISEMVAGKEGALGRDYNMRWVASMVADVHRMLSRGGLFMYPADRKDPSKPGKLRLMYEANPMSLLVEAAGGLATDGRGRILEIAPSGLHQRVPVVMGARDEVARLMRYEAETLGSH